jgi:hypothetical protein
LSFDRFYDAEFNPTGLAAPTSIAKPGKPNRHCPVSPWLDPDRSGFEVALGLVALCLGHFKKTLTLAVVQTLAATGCGFTRAVPLARIGAHALAHLAAGMHSYWRGCKQGCSNNGDCSAGGFFCDIHG